MPGYFSIPTELYPSSYTLPVLDKINKRGAYAPATRAAAPAATTAGPVTGYDPRYGGVPSAPNVNTETLNAILNNLKNMTDLDKLSQAMGKASADSARQQVLATIPNFDALMGKFSGNVEEGSRGVLPADVMGQLNQRAAEYGVATGSLGPAANSAAMRAMGLTSYGIQQDALKNMATLTGMVPKGVPFDPSSMMINPATAIELSWLANQLAAAPIPAAARQDELARQNAGLNAGMRAAISPYGTAGSMGGGGSNPNLAWLNSLIGGASTAGGVTNVPRGTTTGTGTTSARTEDDIIAQYMDEIAPVEWPGGIPQGTYYDPWEDVMSNNPLGQDYFANTGNYQATDTVPLDEYYAFPEWY